MLLSHKELIMMIINPHKALNFSQLHNLLSQKSHPQLRIFSNMSKTKLKNFLISSNFQNELEYNTLLHTELKSFSNQ